MASIKEALRFNDNLQDSSLRGAKQDELVI